MILIGYVEFIQSNFDADDADFICGIPLCPNFPPDTLVWHFIGRVILLYGQCIVLKWPQQTKKCNRGPHVVGKSLVGFGKCYGSLKFLPRLKSFLGSTVSILFPQSKLRSEEDVSFW